MWLLCYYVAIKSFKKNFAIAIQFFEKPKNGLRKTENSKKFQKSGLSLGLLKKIFLEKFQFNTVCMDSICQMTLKKMQIPPVKDEPISRLSFNMISWIVVESQLFRFFLINFDFHLQINMVSLICHSYPISRNLNF